MAWTAEKKPAHYLFCTESVISSVICQQTPNCRESTETKQGDSKQQAIWEKAVAEILDQIPPLESW